MQSTLLTIGRALLAALFLVAGVRKVLAFAGTVAYIKSKGLPAPEVLAALTIALEIGGGVLLLLNRFTLPIAFAFAGFCLASAAIFHNFWAVEAAQYANQLNHFFKNVALAGGFLAVAAASSNAQR